MHGEYRIVPLTIVLRMCLSPYGSVFSAVAKSVCNTDSVGFNALYYVLYCLFFINLRSAECVCSYYGLRVCS